MNETQDLKATVGKEAWKADPEHAQKQAVDAYGGDPLNPNDVVLGRIAAVIKSGTADDLVTRWANSCSAVLSEGPAGKPKRELLLKLADAVKTGKTTDEITAWANGESKPPPR